MSHYDLKFKKKYGFEYTKKPIPVLELIQLKSNNVDSTPHQIQLPSSRLQLKSVNTKINPTLKLLLEK